MRYPIANPERDGPKMQVEKRRQQVTPLSLSSTTFPHIRYLKRISLTRSNLTFLRALCSLEPRLAQTFLNQKSGKRLPAVIVPCAEPWRTFRYFTNIHLSPFLSLFLGLLALADRTRARV